jgi:2-polyprenyl-3-methyl-5-hydroxy-6-metoxy-1,4-benzoquinol methylase
MKDLNKQFIEERYCGEWKIPPVEKVRVRILTDLVGRNMKVLDLGCYEGSISALLKNKGNEITGVDLSFKALKFAQEKGVKPINADLSVKLPFRDNVFDVVLAAEVIEHLYDLKGFLLEVKRVLKKEGTLILSTPNLASLGRRLFLFFGKNPLIEVEFEKEAAGHIRYFVKKTLIDLLSKYGFEVRFFCSDAVNFDNSGRRFSSLLAKIFPGLGKSLIIKAMNK